jgi:aminoglycoside 3-N-acetyltransferase
MAGSTDRPPVTAERLRSDLEALGVEPGTTLVVHSSLSSIGWVVGGAPAVVGALVATLGERGTLAMPAATPLCADPATWSPPVPEAWWQEVREHLPPFDRRTTPTSMGAIPETFRNWPGTLRSEHPLESVCARGPRAEEILTDHPLDFSEGPGAPFGRLHDLDSRVLLIGVGFNRCTALHLAETLVAKRRTSTFRVPHLDGGRRVWLEMTNVADDNGRYFPEIGERYMAEGRARRGSIGEAPSLLFPMRDLVAFARRYFDARL